ncbi:MAG: hypothetical protein D6802_01670 [Ardenticatenia bacterium]|uniref:Uncharacterized protein n=2 Tax=Ardenticatena maritima TaxID=872965 RepID=A0A0N8GSM6_9CHLR|nr:hypothetical protein [Ardenticatena maritima]KPL89722.1 hypothetical protein SE16_04875 [Ardenticatena maritima]RME13359.1 MAG: hypothetical protein D6802_01670 [Ardenticatenia bacterium]
MPAITYQISYMIRNSDEKIDLMYRDSEPKVGEIVTLKGKQYRIIEVEPLILPKSKFAYYHVLCEPVRS